MGVKSKMDSRFRGNDGSVVVTGLASGDSVVRRASERAAQPYAGNNFPIVSTNVSSSTGFVT